MSIEDQLEDDPSARMDSIRLAEMERFSEVEALSREQLEKLQGDGSMALAVIDRRMRALMEMDADPVVIMVHVCQLIYALGSTLDKIRLEKTQ